METKDLAEDRSIDALKAAFRAEPDAAAAHSRALSLSQILRLSLLAPVMAIGITTSLYVVASPETPVAAMLHLAGR